MNVKHYRHTPGVIASEGLQAGHSQLFAKQFLSIVIILAFLINSFGPIPNSQAQEIYLPVPGVRIPLSSAFTPASLKGLSINAKDPFKFDFIIERGNIRLNQIQKKAEYTKLIKYFLAALAVPDQEQWVNLSPYEKERIIPKSFGMTAMGCDLLAEDYMLKQITASMIYPEDKIGKEFWKKVYAQAQAKYGTTNVPINTFNKVWIIPDKATVYEKGNTVYVLESHLKVMLEQDYLALKKNKESVILSAAKDLNDVNILGSQVVRQIVLPALEKEVNEGKNFAALRQVYSGMLLATWYKRVLKESILARVYANQAKVKGIEQDPKNNQRIYEEYLKAYKKGVFNYIKEEAVPDGGDAVVVHKYFSGGMQGYNSAEIKAIGHPNQAQKAAIDEGLQNADLAQTVLSNNNAAMNTDEGFMVKRWKSR